MKTYVVHNGFQVVAVINAVYHQEGNMKQYFDMVDRATTIRIPVLTISPETPRGHDAQSDSPF